jgi:hypothetical protein
LSELEKVAKKHAVDKYKYLLERTACGLNPSGFPRHINLPQQPFSNPATAVPHFRHQTVQ